MRRLPILVERSAAQAHAETLQIARDYEALVYGTGGVSCVRGCHHCCYFPVIISVWEGIALYQWLVSHRLWTPKLRESFEETKTKTWDLAAEIWLLSMIPCPLLKDNECSAYEARPLFCRTVFSRGDPYHCHPHRLGAGQAGILSREETIDQLRTVETRILKKHRQKLVLLPLAAAVLLGEQICKGKIELEEMNMALFEEWSARQ